ncbi:hypothetical protein VTJ04DRAFT_1343 [Mycothermus thermophilus]|uniref:uncharacterized protein n=1 Tax=Humicola insolens TaxID=85995 RepID=UPI003742BBD9
MKLTIAFGLSLFALPSVLAAGESCYYWDGAKYGNVYGTCGNPNTCIQNMGYWVADRCPGGSNNRCCIRRSCTTTTGLGGLCTTVDRCIGSRGPGHNQAGRCPGPSNVQCCY